MTQAARKVLSDCKLALRMLEEESDLNRWRIHWAAAVALNRAVGSVLHKVDGKNPVIRRASEERFSKWKEKSHKSHEIFREFIDKQRNNILKEYTFSYSQDDEIYVVINNKSPNQEDDHIADSSDMIPIGNNIYRPIVDGYRAGDDARDVLSDAIEWWEKELDVIDKKISRQKND